TGGGGGDHRELRVRRAGALRHRSAGCRADQLRGRRSPGDPAGGGAGMRTLEPGLAAHLASGATTLATCWRIERTDGVVLGFTDHDLPLRFAGTDYLPAHGLDGGEAVQKLGPQTDTAEVVGVLHAAAIAE